MYMKYMKNIWIIVSIIIIFLLLVIRLFFSNDIIEYNSDKFNLEENGIKVFKNVLDTNEIEEIVEKCHKEKNADIKSLILYNRKIQNLISENLGGDYILHDYIFIIKKSTIHTCHRDANGDFFNKNQKFPSYTMLIYLEDMEKCLGAIPNSHKHKNSYSVNIFDKLINIPCKKGDAILLNANLIHVGCINKKSDNLRLQLKMSHKDDIDKLQYYQNYNKILNKDNRLPVFIRKAQRNLSCMFPFFSNLSQNEVIKTSRGSVEGANIGIFQQAFSYLFYGNKDFYDLPNAF